MISSKKFGILIVGVALILISIVLKIDYGYTGKPLEKETLIAEVSLDGKVIESINLQEVKEPYNFKVKGENITNVIEVKPGAICVKEANCPDQNCVRHGWLQSGLQPIVCLPNRLTIKLVKDEGTQIDGMAR